MTNVHMCDCHTLPYMHVTQPFYCPESKPGYLREPYHLPGYTGHIASMRDRVGGTFGKLSNDAVSDPCVAQAPIPILQQPGRCCNPDTPTRCDDSVYIPRDCCCPNDSKGSEIYRSCEPLCSSYTGHVPGLNFHNLGRTLGRASFGSGKYMEKCLYYNTFSKN